MDLWVCMEQKIEQWTVLELGDNFTHTPSDLQNESLAIRCSWVYYQGHPLFFWLVGVLVFPQNITYSKQSLPTSDREVYV